jgi:hypothetical protein
MTVLESLRDAMERLAVFEDLDVDAGALPASALGLSDRSVRNALGEVTTLSRQVETLRTVLAGVASVRSGRERGHGGLVQGTGHRTPVEFIRDVTGMTRGEAIRTVKTGEALLQATLGVAGPDAPAAPEVPLPEPGSALPQPVAGPDHAWHHVLDQALLAGEISTAQHDAIRRGLGEPPTIPGRDPEEVAATWRSAAARLLSEAPMCTVEDLRARARTLRDLADPEGAESRHQALFDRRAYRSWTDADGVRSAKIVFDPEMGAWEEHLFATALSPRRGGPRFVADDQKKKADTLTADPRSNEQLAYDLFIDLLRTGAQTGHDDVYGSKEAGVRLMVMKDAITGPTARRDAFGRLVATACADDGQLVVPASVLERALCASATIEVLTDTAGNPLDVGRELRLFTRRQRIGLVLRDGGCLWPGCDRPAHMTEAHHIDP